MSRLAIILRAIFLQKKKEMRIELSVCNDVIIKMELSILLQQSMHHITELDIVDHIKNTKNSHDVASLILLRFADEICCCICF